MSKTKTKPRRAYVAVIVEGGFKLAIAEEDQPYFRPFPDDSDLGGSYNSWEHARETAAECNKRLGLTPDEALKIAASSMGASMKEARP